MNAKQTPSFNEFSSLAQVTHYEGRKFFIISYHNDPEDPLQDNLPQLNDLPEPAAHVKCAIFEVGEVGGTNRWWRGIWTLDDVKNVVGAVGTEVAHQNVINIAVERFVGGNNNLANIATHGIESQSTQKETQTDSQASISEVLSVNMLQIVVELHGSPIQISLSELSVAESAARSNQVLLVIATQVAETQKAVLFPSLKSEATKEKAKASPQRENSPTRGGKRQEDSEKQIEYLKNELSKYKKAEEAAPPPVIQPGRSLGNPTKKARKIEALEFEDESEEEKPVKAKKHKARA